MGKTTKSWTIFLGNQKLTSCYKINFWTYYGGMTYSLNGTWNGILLSALKSLYLWKFLFVLMFRREICQKLAMAKINRKVRENKNVQQMNYNIPIYFNMHKMKTCITVRYWYSYVEKNMLCLVNFLYIVIKLFFCQSF